MPQILATVSLIVVAWVVLQSFLAVSDDLLIKGNHWQELNKQEKKFAASISNENKIKLAEIFWQEGKLKEAEKLFLELKKSDLEMAEFYLDQGHFEQAIFLYNQILAKEQTACNLNNLGIAHYMKAQTIDNLKERRKQLIEALKYYQAAIITGQKNGDKEQLIKTAFSNQNFALRDLKYLPL